MKPFLSILTIISLAASCTRTTPEKIQAINKFDTLPLPIDSTIFYFKTKASSQETMRDALDTFVNSWYSYMLFGLKEPVLKNYKGDKEIYRFTWLRSFNHPAVVRVEKQGNIIRLFSKVSNGTAGYEPGKIVFDTTFDMVQKQVDTINHKLEIANFWNLKTESRDNTGEDGSEWIIEVYKEDKYHMAVRWTPEKRTAFRSIGKYMLSISQIKNEKGEHGDY